MAQLQKHLSKRPRLTLKFTQFSFSRHCTNAEAVSQHLALCVAKAELGRTRPEQYDFGIGVLQQVRRHSLGMEVLEAPMGQTKNWLWKSKTSTGLPLEAARIAIPGRTPISNLIANRYTHGRVQLQLPKRLQTGISKCGSARKPGW